MRQPIEPLSSELPCVRSRMAAERRASPSWRPRSLRASRLTLRAILRTARLQVVCAASRTGSRPSAGQDRTSKARYDRADRSAASWVAAYMATPVALHQQRAPRYRIDDAGPAMHLIGEPAMVRACGRR
jgi:hypothetical protein